GAGGGGAGGLAARLRPAGRRRGAPRRRRGGGGRVRRPAVVTHGPRARRRPALLRRRVRGRARDMMEERRLGPVVGLGTWNTFGGDAKTAGTGVSRAPAAGCRRFDPSPQQRRASSTLR